MKLPQLSISNNLGGRKAKKYGCGKRKCAISDHVGCDLTTGEGRKGDDRCERGGAMREEKEICQLGRERKGNTSVKENVQ